MALPNFWNDQKKALADSKRYQDLQDKINKFNSIKSDFNLGKLSNENLTLKIKELKALTSAGKFNNNKAILSIFAGTGGRDAEDWVAILARMYQRFLEQKDFPAVLLDTVRGEGGIKSISFEVKKKGAYGLLKRENGVHRLVRISPFSAKGLRQTSFALVEITPEIDNPNIELNPAEIKIDTYKSSGPGGQYVNKTESAIRILHIPTKIIVTCQSERSQSENKEKALKILKSKLYLRKQEELESERRKETGQTQVATWGNQIRSYVFQPYQLVKDHITNKETTQLGKVLDGDLGLIRE